MTCEVAGAVTDETWSPGLGQASILILQSPPNSKSMAFWHAAWFTLSCGAPRSSLKARDVSDSSFEPPPRGKCGGVGEGHWNLPLIGAERNTSGFCSWVYSLEGFVDSGRVALKGGRPFPYR